MRAKQYGESLLLLLDVADELDNLKIPYMVVGAVAVSVYGLPRASIDADAVIQIGQGEEKKFFRSLKNKRIIFEVRRGDYNDPVRLVIKVKDKYGNRVDLLSGLRGMKPDAFKRARKVKFRKKALKVIGAEDLIAMKAAAGGYQDIEDIKGIIQVRGKRLNRNLLKEITAGYGKRVQKKINPLLS